MVTVRAATSHVKGIGTDDINTARRAKRGEKDIKPGLNFVAQLSGKGRGSFALDARAPVAVHFRGGVIGRLLRWFQILCWAGVGVGWFVTRRRARAHPA